MSENLRKYLERQTYQRSLKSEPSIVKLIENKSDLSKLSTLSESSIVKFVENQSEHLSKKSSRNKHFIIFINVNSKPVLASTEDGGGVREVNYIYAIPYPTGHR